MKKMTHTGCKISASCLIPDTYRRKIKLRKTPKFWIDEYGEKYHAESGQKLPILKNDSPTYRLDLDSIKKVENVKEIDLFQK